MKKNIKRKINIYLKAFLSFVIILMSITSVVMQVPNIELYNLLNIKSAVNNSGKMDLNFHQKKSEIDDGGNDKKDVKEVYSAKNTTDAKEETTTIDNSGKKKYPVYEEQYGTAGEISIKNNTNYTIDIEKELAKELPFDIIDTQKPQVLIVHTHASEAYLLEDTGYYYEDYTSRSLNNKTNILQVGKKLTKTLNDRGISTLQSLVHHDSPTYNGSYDRSEKTIYQYLKKYPSIKVVIDVHRDAIGYGGEQGKYKPTFVANGKKAAQIMIMSGYDPTGAYGFEHWQNNLGFAVKLEETAERLYPGMTRPLYFGDFAYNMFINSGSLLIEVGTDANTLDEAVYTGELLGNVIAEVLS